MCGIAGIISTDRSRDVGPAVERLTAELAHRGPDGTGLRFLGDRWAAFGHRRLSIVDLECGAQPMGNEDGQVWVVLNGELYNHLEIRKDLEHLGHRFTTRSDTEVLVHGWEEWGAKLLERVNGIYAFALFDGRRGAGEVWLARDPVGVKPLYVGRTDGQWWFASELAAARRCGLVNEVARPEAVDEFLVYRFMRDELPAPPQAFAVGFRDAPVDELSAARRAAEALGVPLAELAVSQEEYLASWPAQIASLGEPIANSGVLLVGLLSQLVRRTHKVVLSGQGADEPLGGYPRHAAERFAGAARLLRPILILLPEHLLSSDRVARMQRVGGAREEGRRFTETLAVFGPAEAVALTGHALDPDALAEPVRRWLTVGDGADSLNRLLWVDARLSLADDLLIVADHMSMASSVELRVPFLDLEFLGLVDRMPSTYKVSWLGERKWLYRAAVADLLPTGVRSRLTGLRARTGRKLGFTTPLIPW